MGRGQGGSGRFERLKPRPIVGRQPHRQLRSRRSSTCWSSTSPRACSQAIRSPSPAGSADLVDLLAAAQQLGHASRAAASSPSPVSAEIGDDVLAPLGLARAAPRARRRSSRSILFHASSRGGEPSSASPSDASTSSTSSRCASLSGWAMSRTWTMQVGRRAPPPASRGTRRPARSAGRRRSRPCPTGSPCRSPGRRISRMVGSSVANSRSSANTASPVMRLKSVDFPALV